MWININFSRSVECKKFDEFDKASIISTFFVLDIFKNFTFIFAAFIILMRYIIFLFSKRGMGKVPRL